MAIRIGRSGIKPRWNRSARWITRHEATILSALVGLLSLVYYLSYVRYFSIDVDEGLLVNGAVRTLAGQIPLKDFHQYMPGHYYPVALAFLVFGKSILVERLFFLVLHVLKNILAYRLARKILPFPFSVVPALLLMTFPGFWVKGYINLILIVNLTLLWNFLDRPGTKRLTALGASIGVSVYFREDMAGYSLLTAGLVILIEGARRKEKFGKIIQSGLVLGGAVCVALIPLFTLYLSQNALPDLARGVSETIRLGQVESQDTTLAEGGLSWPLRLSKGYLYYLTPLMFVVMGGILGRRFKRAKPSDNRVDMKILAALLLGFFSYYHIWHWHNEFRFPQTGAILHLLWAFLLFLSFRPLLDLGRPLLLRKIARAAGGLLVGAACLGVQVYFVLLCFKGHYMWRYDAGSIDARSGPHRPIVRTTRSGILPPTEQAIPLSRLLDYIVRHSGPQDRLFCFGESVLYFLSERANATEFDNGRIPAYFPDQRQKFTAQILQNKPKFLILRDWEFRWWGPKMPDAFETIMADYILESEVYDYYVLGRLSNPDPDIRRGNSLLWRGDARGSAGAYRRALESRPNDLLLVWNLGRLFFLEGLWERAAAVLDGYALRRSDTLWELRWGSPTRRSFSGHLTFDGKEDISRFISVTVLSPNGQKVEWKIDKNRLSFASEITDSCAGLDLTFQEGMPPSSIDFRVFADGKPVDNIFLHGRGWGGVRDDVP